MTLLVDDPPDSLTTRVDERRQPSDLFRFSFHGWDSKTGHAIEGTFDPFDPAHVLPPDKQRPSVIWLLIVDGNVGILPIKEVTFRHHDAFVHRSPHGAALVLIRREGAKMIGGKCRRIIEAHLIGSTGDFTNDQLIGFARAGHADDSGELSLPVVPDSTVIDYAELTVAG